MNSMILSSSKVFYKPRLYQQSPPQFLAILFFPQYIYLAMQPIMYGILQVFFLWLFCFLDISAVFTK